MKINRGVLRGAVVLIAVSLIYLWIQFARDIFARSGNMPAAAAIMLPIFFCSLALGAALGGARGEGIQVAIAGGLSLVPMGVLLVLFPGSPRLIGTFDVVLIVLGVLLIRSDPANEASEEATAPSE